MHDNFTGAITKNVIYLLAVLTFDFGKIVMIVLANAFGNGVAVAC